MAKKSKSETRVRLNPEIKAKLAKQIVNEAKKLHKKKISKTEGYATLRKKFKVQRITPFFKVAGWKWGKVA